ncbi:acyltransferase family protein, partial [uncultured Fibrobacter sp.]|uniref:acyltransferase family protein n=1 Tax=uncultured Fibrobacter sp. TaxID=261512 RepID=UPI0026212C2E
MRISYFDFLRSVAILMVVFIHCFGFCYTSSDISIPVIIVRNLMNVAVPLFFAISGYFLASKQMENGGYVQFLKRQIPRVYIPVLFCSLFFLFGDLSSVFSLKPFIKFFSCGYSVYYFIAVIIQCYLLLWFLKKHVSLFSLKVLIFLGLIWWSIIHYLLGIYMGRTVPLILYAGNFVPWGLFFVEGLYFGSRKNATESLKLSVIVGLSIVLFVLSVVESYFIMEKTQTLQGLGQKASIFCFNAFLC